MYKIEITDFAEFENIIEQVKNSLKNIKEIFEKDRQNFKQINATDIWTCETQKAIYEKCEELAKNYPLIENSIQYYIDFMTKVLSEYGQLDANLSKKVQEDDLSSLSVSG